MPYVRPDVPGFSPLATVRAPVPRDVKDRAAPVYGVVVHCTGSGIVTKALAAKADPFQYTLDHYANAAKAPYFAHYVIGFDGQIGQVADEHEAAQHVGFPPEHRKAFLEGSWANRLPPAYVKAWRARWPGMKSPAHLFPGPSPNNVMVGMELLVWQAGCAGRPLRPGLKYTEAQHRAAAALTRDILTRWGVDGPNVMTTGQVCCHEDLNPIERTSGGRGWDPGVGRPDPWFDWAMFADMVTHGALS